MAVGADVVQDEGEDVVVGGELVEVGAQWGVGGDVESGGGVGGDVVGELGFGGGCGGEVVGCGWVDVLGGLAVVEG